MLPSTITSIGEYLFVNCVSLTSIIVDIDNVNYCDDNGVLYNKDKTTLLIYPIGNLATSYIIPVGVKHIADNAFYSCNNLTNIILPNTLISIGDESFDSCLNLENIVIPASVKSIADGAFQDCNKLESVTFESDSQLISIGVLSFSGCENLLSIIIPIGVDIIDRWAFDDCVNLSINSEIAAKPVG